MVIEIMNDGPQEEQLSSRRVYAGRILNLRVDEIKTKKGRKATREVVEHHAAVGILALTEKNSVLLVRQFRYAAGEETLEICAGLIEKGEGAKDAAAREMQEELGYSPAVLREIGSFYTSPGFCTEVLTLFLAEDLTASSLPQDDDEDVKTIEIPCAKIPSLLAKGVIQDGKTFAALAWFLAWKGLRVEFR